MFEPTYLKELSWISIILLVGVLTSIICFKLNIPNILLLLIIGIVLGETTGLTFGQSFLTTLGLFALIMIIFDSTSQFKPREVAKLSPYAIKLAFIFLFLNIIFLTFITHLFFNGQFTFRGVLLSVLFSALMSGTSPSTALTLLHGSKEKLIEILKLESVVNTPLIVILPLIILYWFTGELVITDITVIFFRGVMAGIGTGLVLGLVIFRLMKTRYVENLSSLALIASALVSYTLAEYIGGNGVLSVTALGIVFGFSELKEKESLKKFIEIFTNVLTVVVFVILGLVIKVSWADTTFLIKSFALYLIYLMIRYFSVTLASSHRSPLTIKKRLFMTLGISKGIEEAVIAFVLVSVPALAPGMFTSADALYLNEAILKLVFLFILYSVIISSIAVKLQHYLLSDNLITKKGRMEC